MTERSESNLTTNSFTNRAGQSTSISGDGGDGGGPPNNNNNSRDTFDDEVLEAANAFNHAARINRLLNAPLNRNDLSTSPLSRRHRMRPINFMSISNMIHLYNENSNSMDGQQQQDESTMAHERQRAPAGLYCSMLFIHVPEVLHAHGKVSSPRFPMPLTIIKHPFL